MTGGPRSANSVLAVDVLRICFRIFDQGSQKREQLSQSNFQVFLLFVDQDSQKREQFSQSNF